MPMGPQRRGYNGRGDVLGMLVATPICCKPNVFPCKHYMEAASYVFAENTPLLVGRALGSATERVQLGLTPFPKRM